MRTHRIVTSLSVLISLLVAVVHAEEPEWISLFDGKTLERWEFDNSSREIDDIERQPRNDSAKVVNGKLALTGEAVLNSSEDYLQDFDFTTSILTECGATGSLEICNMGHVGTPLDKIRVALNNSREWSAGPRTGSLRGVMCHYKSISRDGEWFKLRVSAQNGLAHVWINDTRVADAYGWQGCGRVSISKEKGPARIFFKDMQVKLLPNDPSQIEKSPPEDDISRQAAVLLWKGFPLINYHIHLKGDLTLEKALAHSRETGVFYGIAANCGLDFPIRNDQGVKDYIKKLEGQPCFIGMQAEGREWPTLFSKEAIAKFDYIFTDAMTIVDHRGKRARLWMPAEVDIPDKQAFMELLVRTIEQILDNEPVDIYANPTYLPDVLIKEYDTLWTPERVKRVIDAAARNGVAIEISNRLKLPKADFIRQAKKVGIKFTLGTNNVDSKLGREEYALQMIRQCDLKPGDMFLPKPDGKKPIQVRGFKGKAKEAIRQKNEATEK